VHTPTLASHCSPDNISAIEKLQGKNNFSNRRQFFRRLGISGPALILLANWKKPQKQAARSSAGPKPELNVLYTGDKRAPFQSV